MAQNDKIPEVIGLVPAAGDGTRLGALPCSKEVYPVGFRIDESEGELRVKVAAHYLIEMMERAGIKKIFVLIKKGKWDIPAYLCDGSRFGVNICYLVIESSPHVPFTLDRAYPFIKTNYIALGFPDILIKTKAPFKILLQRHRETGADVVLGCFPVDNFNKFDMVVFGDNGWVQSLKIKPKKTNLKYGWAIALWTPKFTHFIHECITAFNRKSLSKPDKKETYLGDIFIRALDEKFKIQSVLFPDDWCKDIGTAKDLFKATSELSS